MPTIKIDGFVKEYVKGVKGSLDNVPMEKLDELTTILYRAYVGNKKVIVMGNGGSAACASHFVCDLAKGTVVPNKKRFKALALCDSIPMVTAYANDRTYEDVFSEQLRNIVEAGDVVIGISASGNSKNVLNAIKLAQKYSAITVGLTGFQGGALKGIVSFCVTVPNDNMEQVEDVHLVILHIVKLFLKSRREADR